MEAASTGMSDLVPNGNVVNRSCPGGCVHGACGGDGLCVCEDGWSGSTCEDYCPGFPACGGPLRGHCSVVSIAQNQTARRCVCQSGFSGDGCDNYSCPPCLNGGSCFFSEDGDNRSVCQCLPAYGGDFCQEQLCPANCSGAGDCIDGRCSCWLGAHGESCNETSVSLEPLTNCVQISLVWGIAGYRADNVSAPEYSPAFDLLDPQVQLWMLQACTAARNDSSLLVRPEVPCWIEAWRSFVVAVGGSFPVAPRSLASEALQAFFHQKTSEAFLKDLATDADNFTGHAKFAVMRMLINAPRNGGLPLLLPLKDKWMDFVADLNRHAPLSAGSALMVSQTWTATDMEYSIMSKTLASLILSIGIAVACVVVFSQNVLIGLFVLLTILMEVCPLFGFLFGVMRYEFGAIEAIGVVTFVGMSVDYCLHLAHGYHVVEKTTRSEKLQLTLVNLGPSILGGALTTAAATAFLLPCRIVLFVKLGTMLVANTILSLLYTFVFLGPLLMILGPLEDVGSFLWLFRHVCGCGWAFQNAKPYRRHEAAVGGVPTGLHGQEPARSRTRSIRYPSRRLETDTPQPDEQHQQRSTKVRFDRSGSDLAREL